MVERAADPNVLTGDNIVTVDLEAEIQKLAKTAKIDPEKLNEPIALTNRDYLKELVVQHYHGRDVGYAEGFAVGYYRAGRWMKLLGSGACVSSALLVIYGGVWLFRHVTINLG